MKKKKLLFPTNNKQKFLILSLLIILVSILSYGLSHTVTILAQGNQNPSFYCLLTRGSRVDEIPCIWFRDIGLKEVPAPNPNKYYPNQKLSEFIEFIPSLEVGTPSWKASIRSACNRVKVNTDYNSVINNWKTGGCSNFAACLTDYYSGIYLHNLQLVKSRYPSGSQIHNLANKIQTDIPTINCDNSTPVETILSQLRDIHSMDLALSNLTEQNPGSNPSPPSRPIIPQKPIPPSVANNPIFCWYENNGGSYHLPCVYFTSLGLTPTPIQNPNLYSGFPGLKSTIENLYIGSNYTNSELEAVKYCNELKTPISQFNSRISIINQSPLNQRYPLIGEYFKNGIYLHTLQEIALRPQTSEVNTLISNLASEISTYNCNQSGKIVLDKLGDWARKDSLIVDSLRKNQNLPAVPVPTSFDSQVPITYNPLFCIVKASNTGVTYELLCDYVRRLGLGITPSENQVYLGHSSLKYAYTEIQKFREDQNRGNESLVRGVCSFLRREPQFFDQQFFSNISSSTNIQSIVADIAGGPNYFHTINLVGLTIENINPIESAVKSFNPIVRDNVLIPVDGDTSLLDTSLEIKKNSKKSGIDSMTRGDMIGVLQNTFKQNPSTLNSMTTDQLKIELSQKYDSTSDDLFQNINNQNDKSSTENPEELVQRITQRLRNMDCIQSSKFDIMNEMGVIYEFDQELAGLSFKNNSRIYNKLRDFKQKFGY